MKTQKSEIKISVSLDENKIPESIVWTAEDGKIKDKDTKSFMLSIWDSNEKTGLKLDLWTKDMTVDEMKAFFHQTFLFMAETFERSVGDHRMSETIRDFASYYAEKMEIEDK